MNRTEREYAERLAALKAGGQIADYAYEAIKLRLADNTFYTADFLVVDNEGYLELHEVKHGKADPAGGKVKALIEDDANAKLKIAAETRPEFRFVLAIKVPARLQKRAGRPEWILRDVKRQRPNKRTDDQ